MSTDNRLRSEFAGLSNLEALQLPTSALLGVVQFVLAAISSALVGWLEDGTAHPMVSVMALCSALLKYSTAHSSSTANTVQQQQRAGQRCQPQP